MGVPWTPVWQGVGIIAAIRAEHVSPRKPLNSKRMTKQQLIEKVAAKTESKKSEVEVVVDSVLAMIAEALQANERVDLRGFGSFVVKERKERQGRNPRTGETITIAAKRELRPMNARINHRMVMMEVLDGDCFFIFSELVALQFSLAVPRLASLSAERSITYCASSSKALSGAHK